jgi:hypothetical protein
MCRVSSLTRRSSQTLSVRGSVAAGVTRGLRRDLDALREPVHDVFEVRRATRQLVRRMGRAGALGFPLAAMGPGVHVAAGTSGHTPFRSKRRTRNSCRHSFFAAELTRIRGAGQPSLQTARISFAKGHVRSGARARSTTTQPTPISRPQTLDVLPPECLPAAQRVRLILPLAGQIEEHARRAAVIHHVGEPASLGNGAESMLVLPRERHKGGSSAKDASSGVCLRIQSNAETRAFGDGRPGEQLQSLLRVVGWQDDSQLPIDHGSLRSAASEVAAGDRARSCGQVRAPVIF